jgi:putative addiction module component (TIGR02574 family)
MSSADMLAEILRLPVEERARLALELIRSLDTESEPGAADAWDAEIARRGAEVDAGMAVTMTIDEYRVHLRQRRANARVDEPANPRLAVAEIDHEVDYYESRQAGLGTELENEIDAAFSLILRFPEAAPQWRDRNDRRVAPLDRFPFTIPYQITYEDIVVLALAHTSRRPDYWARRSNGAAR